LGKRIERLPSSKKGWSAKTEREKKNYKTSKRKEEAHFGTAALMTEKRGKQCVSRKVWASPSTGPREGLEEAGDGLSPWLVLETDLGRAHLEP